MSQQPTHRIGTHHHNHMWDHTKTQKLPFRIEGNAKKGTKRTTTLRSMLPAPGADNTISTWNKAIKQNSPASYPFARWHISMHKHFRLFILVLQQLRSQRLRRFPFQYRFLFRIPQNRLSTHIASHAICQFYSVQTLAQFRCLFIISHIFRFLAAKWIGTCFGEAKKIVQKCQQPHKSRYERIDRTWFRWNRQPKTKSGKEDDESREEMKSTK